MLLSRCRYLALLAVVLAPLAMLAACDDPEGPIEEPMEGAEPPPPPPAD